MKRRLVATQVRAALRDWPAVVVVGPRQCGKTTLARALSRSYFDLEQNEDQLRLDASWSEVTASPRLTVLDEAQSWPELFPRLRGAIDGERKRNGRFLLTGSVSPGLMRDVSESLAGRPAFSRTIYCHFSACAQAADGSMSRMTTLVSSKNPVAGTLGGRSTDRRFGPILDLETWNAGEFADVVGHENPSLGARMRREPQVVVADDVP